MRRRTLYGVNYKISGGNIPASQANACDICLYEKGTDSLVIIPYSLFNIGTYPANSYTPVGVVVIPGSHNVYGDGSCGVMSLKEMNYTTPDTGSPSRQYMYWGQYGTDISTLTNYTQVCYVGKNGTVNKTVQGVTVSAFLPSDNFTTVQNPYDKDTWFYNNNFKEYIPSPYNDDDTRNPAYYQTASPSSTENAMSDFDGVGNTKILTDLATEQSDWKTASKITNKRDSGYSPAACCCWRYHTEGTKQGDWYLPACGELGYIIPKFNKINQSISTLTSAYGSRVGLQLDDDTSFWTSTEYSSDFACTVGTGNGNVSGMLSGKYNGSWVRAFLRVGA